MPFSTLNDPVDLARASGALEKAWLEVRSSTDAGRWASERTRLAYIVASLAIIALDEDDLAARAIERFRREA